jgi:hypothetical protein
LWVCAALLVSSGAARGAWVLASAAPSRFFRIPLDSMSRPAQALALFALGFVPLALGGYAIEAASPDWRDGTIYEHGLPLPGADEFVSMDPEVLDHDVYYHDLYGAVEQARRADVVFTGNSRAVYAFRREALQPNFAGTGLRYYNLAFVGGADAFPLAVIRKYDLRPKILVVNMHGFFADDATRFGSWAMGRDRFTGWNLVWERQASWNVRYLLHQLVPHWPTLLFYRKSQQVIYRRLSDGTWRWVMPIIEPKPIGNLPVPRNVDDPAENAGIESWTTLQLRVAPRFVAEMEARGTRVVFVYVPWTDPVAFYSAKNVALALGKPLIVAWPDGLMGAAGSHMGEESARRYVDALMPMLLAAPEFQRLMPEHRPAP